MAKKKKKAKMGRKSKYELYVLPRLHEITEWRRTMTENQIIEQLGIGRTAFYEYKNKHPELVAALHEGEVLLVADLKGVLVKKAFGYEYEETETIVTVGKKGADEVRKIKTKHMPPDLGSIHLLLKNFDPNWRNDDQTTREMKQKELELKEKKIEQGEW